MSDIDIGDLSPISRPLLASEWPTNRLDRFQLMNDATHRGQSLLTLGGAASANI